MVINYLRNLVIAALLVYGSSAWACSASPVAGLVCSANGSIVAASNYRGGLILVDASSSYDPDGVQGPAITTNGILEYYFDFDGDNVVDYRQYYSLGQHYEQWIYPFGTVTRTILAIQFTGKVMVDIGHWNKFFSPMRSFRFGYKTGGGPGNTGYIQLKVGVKDDDAYGGSVQHTSVDPGLRIVTSKPYAFARVRTRSW